jgi:hypothetical protein
VQVAADRVVEVGPFDRRVLGQAQQLATDRVVVADHRAVAHHRHHHRHQGLGVLSQFDHLALHLLPQEQRKAAHRDSHQRHGVQGVDTSQQGLRQQAHDGA